MANKPKIKNKNKRERKTHGEKEGGKREKTTTTLSEKKEEACNSEQRDKGWIHVIRVQVTTHLAVTTTRQGNRRSRTTPYKERMRGLVKHRDYPAHSYIVNERYNSRNKRASQEKTKQKNKKQKNRSEWQEPVTNPNHNPGRPRNR